MGVDCLRLQAIFAELLGYAYFMISTPNRLQLSCMGTDVYFVKQCYKITQPYKNTKLQVS